MDFIDFIQYKVSESHKNEFLDDAGKDGLAEIIRSDPSIILTFAICKNEAYDIYLVKVESGGTTINNPRSSTSLPLPIVCVWDRLASSITYFPFNTDLIHKYLYKNIPYVGDYLLITKYYPGLDAILLPIYSSKKMIGYAVVTDEEIYSSAKIIVTAHKILLKRYGIDTIRNAMKYQSTPIDQRYFKFKIGVTSDSYDLIQIKKNYAVVAAYGTGINCKENKCMIDVVPFSVEYPLESMYSVADMFRLDIDSLIMCKNDSLDIVRNRLNNGNAYVTDHGFDSVVENATAVVEGTIEYSDYVGDVLHGIIVENYTSVGELLVHTIVFYPRSVYRTEVISAATNTTNLESLTNKFIKRWISKDNEAAMMYRSLIRKAYAYKHKGEFIVDAMDHAESESNLRKINP